MTTEWYEAKMRINEILTSMADIRRQIAELKRWIDGAIQD